MGVIQESPRSNLLSLAGDDRNRGHCQALGTSKNSFAYDIHIYSYHFGYLSNLP